MTNVMTSLFQQSTSPSSVAIFQHHQRMEFTFHNSYVTIQLLPSTVIFCTESSAADTKAIQTRPRCSQVEDIASKILLSSSQSGWPLRNIHISNDNGSFTFYVDVFFPLSLPRLLPDLDCIYEQHGGCFVRSRTCLSFAST